MATEMEKYVNKNAPNDPVADMPGVYKDDAESIPMAQRTQESSLPKAPDPSPFKLGPMASGER